jgi:hypothetical protein
MLDASERSRRLRSGLIACLGFHNPGQLRALLRCLSGLLLDVLPPRAHLSPFLPRLPRFDTATWFGYCFGRSQPHGTLRIVAVDPGVAGGGEEQ